MNDLKKSFAFVAVSGALAATAVWASIPKTTTVEAFNDQGEAFFPDFTNPDDCMTLDIVENDAETGVPQPFKVTFQNGKWVIPSHGNYPADAADRLSQTAAKVIDLKKDTIRSSRTEDHKVLGVIDPLDNKTGMVDGVGKRITLRDKTDRVLAEYILGKDVPGQPGQKFVRRPQQARTYAVKVEAEPSSRFADWIEPNLLGLQANQIRSATFLNEKVDPSVLKIFKGEILRITRKDAAAPWVLAGLPPTEEVDPAKSTALVNALADLKIVGVCRNRWRSRRTSRERPPQRPTPCPRSPSKARGFTSRTGGFTRTRVRSSSSATTGWDTSFNLAG